MIHKREEGKDDDQNSSTNCGHQLQYTEYEEQIVEATKYFSYKRNCEEGEEDKPKRNKQNKRIKSLK